MRRSAPPSSANRLSLVLPKRLRWFVNKDSRLPGEISKILGRALTERIVARSGAPKNAAPAQLHALQRFGSTVNLHIHDHAVVSDGAFALEEGRLRFYPAPAPSPEELSMLVERIRRRILKRMTVMGAVPDAAIAEMLSWPHSGFSLNADVRIEADDRAALERLLHYVLRPALSLKKLSYHPAEEKVRYRPDKGRPGFPKLIEWSPLAFLERFAAIIPPPRKHLVRYYGALGPRSKIRRALTAAAKAPATCEELLAGVSRSVGKAVTARPRSPPLPFGVEAGRIPKRTRAATTTARTGRTLPARICLHKRVSGVGFCA